MAEHVRDFLDPVIDQEAHIMLESAQDPTTIAAAAAGRGIFKMMGAERQPDTDDGEVWRFHDADGHPADVEFRDLSAIAAWTIHGSRGMLYSYTGSSEALWRPVEGSTYISPDVYTGYPESDGLVSVTAALHHATRRGAKSRTNHSQRHSARTGQVGTRSLGSKYRPDQGRDHDPL